MAATVEKELIRLSRVEERLRLRAHKDNIKWKAELAILLCLQHSSHSHEQLSLSGEQSDNYLAFLQPVSVMLKSPKNRYSRV